MLLINWRIIQHNITYRMWLLKGKTMRYKGEPDYSGLLGKSIKARRDLKVDLLERRVLQGNKC